MAITDYTMIRIIPLDPIEEIEVGVPMHLRDFELANEMTWDESREMRVALIESGCYLIGGGATPAYRIEVGV